MQEDNLQAPTLHQAFCCLLVFLVNSGVLQVMLVTLRPTPTTSVPHTLAHLPMLQVPRINGHKVLDEACGTHDPSGKNLQDPSGFSSKKLPEQRAGNCESKLSSQSRYSRAILGSSKPDSQRLPPNPSIPGFPKLSLDLGEVRDRTEDHPGTPRETDVNKEQFTSVRDPVQQVLDPTQPFATSSTLKCHSCRCAISHQGAPGRASRCTLFTLQHPMKHQSQHKDEHPVKNPKP